MSNFRYTREDSNCFSKKMNIGLRIAHVNKTRHRPSRSAPSLTSIFFCKFESCFSTARVLKPNAFAICFMVMSGLAAISANSFSELFSELPWETLYMTTLTPPSASSIFGRGSPAFVMPSTIFRAASLLSALFCIQSGGKCSTSEFTWPLLDHSMLFTLKKKG